MCQHAPGSGGSVLEASESALIERWRGGEQRAFEELVARYEKRVYNLAYRMSGNADDASDLAQEAFVRVFTALPSFKGQSSFATWLYRIATNVCLDELRRRGRQPVLSLDQPVAMEEGPVARQTVDPAAGPLDELERTELRAAVQDGISALQPEHRAVIILRDLQGLPYEEIAGVLACSLGTVKSRLNRARLALRERLSAMELFRGDVVYTGKQAAEGGSRR